MTSGMRQRGQTPLQRVDRAYGEILQEVRVAQTGVQILFAFLLTLAFTSRFATITELQRHIYVVTLMLSAGAAALLIAPAAFHRVVYRQRLKQLLVQAASRLALSGLVLLLLAMVSALLLILDVVIGLGPALVLAARALIWFITWWLLLPAWKRLRHQGHQARMSAPVPPWRRGPGLSMRAVLWHSTVGWQMTAIPAAAVWQGLRRTNTRCSPGLTRSA